MNKEAIAQEIADFLSCDYDYAFQEVEKELQQPGIHVKEAWLQDAPQLPEAIEQFYKRTDAYIFDLVIESERDIRQRWRESVLETMQAHWGDVSSTAVLDYGGGVGTDSLFFARNCGHVAYYDLPSHTSELAARRFARQHVDVTLMSQTSRYATSFDAIVSFEVLEHLVDPLTHIDEMIRLTKAGGMLFLTESFDLVNENYPSHLKTNLAYAGALERLMRERGCQKVTELESRINVFVKGPPVTIIVPIYNAFSHTQDLMQSALTTNPGYPVSWLLVNDASPDPRIATLLASFQESADFPVTIDNRIENLGFVQTCNLGMTAAVGADVILLNSDTIVYDNWVRKLVENAYSADDIATVTPLSNNASAFSIMQNISPKNHVNQLIHDSSAPPLDIPTGVGFCLYIKRSVLEKIGLFDPIFDRGYGEETDLCQRAASMGYRNVLAQNVFIFHAGGASMVAAAVITEGDFTLAAHEQIVNERYPGYEQRVHDFIHSGIIDTIAANLMRRYIVAEATTRPAIAIVIHVDIFAPYLGGTEFHLRDLLGDLQNEYVFYFINPAGDHLAVSASVDGLVHQVFWKTTDYHGLLAALHPSLIHIHHLMHFSPEFISALTQWSGPKVFTIHDYYGLCKSYSLINAVGDFCGVPAEPTCRNCANILFTNGYETPREQRLLHQRLIDSMQTVIAPSHAALTIFRRGIQVPESLVRVMPHPLNIKKVTKPTTKKAPKLSLQEQEWRESVQNFPANTLRVGFIGYGGKQKGAPIIQGIVAACARDPINFVSLGAVVNAKKRNKVISTGNYQRQEIVDLIRQCDIDVMVICSPWPETYSYTLTESWLAGVPVIVGPLGAPAERVKKTGAGVIVAGYQVDAFARVLRDLANDRQMLQQLKDAVQSVEIAADYAAYREMYADLIVRPPAPPQLFGTAAEPGLAGPILVEKKVPFVDALVRLRWRIVPIGSIREKIYLSVHDLVLRLGSERLKNLGEDQQQSQPMTETQRLNAPLNPHQVASQKAVAKSKNSIRRTQHQKAALSSADRSHEQ